MCLLYKYASLHNPLLQWWPGIFFWESGIYSWHIPVFIGFRVWTNFLNPWSSTTENGWKSSAIIFTSSSSIEFCLAGKADFWKKLSHGALGCRFWMLWFLDCMMREKQQQHLHQHHPQRPYPPIALMGGQFSGARAGCLQSRLYRIFFFFAESTLCLGVVSHSEMFPEFAPFPGFIHFLYFTFQKCRCVILPPLALFLSAPLVCDCSPLPPPLHTNTRYKCTLTNHVWLEEKKRERGWKKNHSSQ